jgi:hypothetical protein
MKKNLIFLGLIFIALSCNDNSIDSSSEVKKDIQTKNRSILELFSNYGEVFTEKYVVKKYEVTMTGDAPSTTVNINLSSASNLSYNGSAANVTEGNGSLYFGPSLYQSLLNLTTFQINGVNFDFPYLTDIKFNKFSSNSITTGTVLTWNRSLGTGVGQVLIVIRPDYISMQQPTPYEAKLILTDDSQEYTIQAGDLSNFPSGTPLVITIARAGYTVSPTESELLIGTASLCHSPVLTLL